MVHRIGKILVKIIGLVDLDQYSAHRLNAAKIGNLPTGSKDGELGREELFPLPFERLRTP